MMNMTIEQIETLVDAVRHYGETTQMIKALEEAGELIQAVAKYLTTPELKKNGKELEDHISEEMADVRILLEQLAIILHNHDRVNGWTQIKLGRLRRQIDMEKARERDG